MAVKQQVGLVGYAIGECTTTRFQFATAGAKVGLGDFVLVFSGEEGAVATTEIWARVTDVRRSNPFLPIDAAHELARNDLDISDTDLASSGDHVIATATILGQINGADSFILHPISVPPVPASRVVLPTTERLTAFLALGSKIHDNISLGHLRGRPDVTIAISSNVAVSRHLAILGMSGGGKTVAARKVISELARIGYPSFVIDPHGDYLGFLQNRERLQGSDVQLFFPEIFVTPDTTEVLFELVACMTDGLTEPQTEALERLIDECGPKGTAKALAALRGLHDGIAAAQESDPRGKSATATWRVVRRAIGSVVRQLSEMENANKKMRALLPDLRFSSLPDPRSAPSQLIRPGCVSVLYLGGYSQIMQTTIVALTLNALYAHRANLSGTIPPFQTFVEEAHTFAPSSKEDGVQVPSLSVIRKLLTQGRKFGTGVTLISQRPGRLDETSLAQCNSVLVLRMVNQKDQSFVGSTIESLSDTELRTLSSLAPGEGFFGGQAVRVPLAIKIDFDPAFVFRQLEDENFVDIVRNWKKASNAS